MIWFLFYLAAGCAWLAIRALLVGYKPPIAPPGQSKLAFNAGVVIGTALAVWLWPFSFVRTLLSRR